MILLEAIRPLIHDNLVLSFQFTSAGTKSAELVKGLQPDTHLCNGCKLPITDRYLLEALGMYWHEGCLKCNCCECKLGDIGSTLYSKANLILCKRDYLRSVEVTIVFPTSVILNKHFSVSNRTVPQESTAQ